MYQKHSLRRVDIAILSVAVLLTMDNGYISDARIALGAVEATPVRANATEQLLVGEILTDNLLAKAS